ncbi:hypothetical protein ACFV2Q_08840 [Streptomyces sp. NPDC059650]|uniref:hypothetical protein n=1 Tax=Streptomyces sp. NPDC059650 TaxID=3346896 RepID=UPI0036C5DDC4
MTENGQGNAPQAAPQPGAPWGPDPAYAQPPAPGQLPPQPGQAEPGPVQSGHVLGPGWEGPGQPHGYGYPPLPEAATQYIPPVPAGPDSAPPGTAYTPPGAPYAPPVPGVPGPQAAAAYDEAATQYIPPVPAGPAAPGHHEAATQYIPPVPAGPAPPAHDEAATQYIPPVPAGPAPPAHDEAATQYIPPVPAGQAAPAPSFDEAATQYIPPVTDGFDGLFRDGDGGVVGSDGHTQQLPPIQEPVLRQPPRRPYPPRGQHPQQSFQPGGPGQQQFAPPPPPEPARRVPPAVIGAVVVGLAVVGLGVGALLSDGKKQNNDPAAAADAPTPSAGSSAAAAEAPVDPARSQAIQLDKLLADSNDSRSSVIKAVDDIKSCRNLDTAASDLRDAARQREELVTRLQDVKIDQLPNNARLSAALNKAWKASADADNSYAAWADDLAGEKGDKKGCKDGRARNTDDASDGNKSSGEATRAKETAAPLWNTIAAKYNLTKRDKSQL